MAQHNKTMPTNADVIDFLATLTDQKQRTDSEQLITIMQNITHELPVMWGPSIIGFGTHHYKYDSGREGDVPDIGFSPRKGKIALYITDDANKFPEIRTRLGKHKTSKACIYINHLEDVDVDVLEELITTSYKDTTKSW